MAKHVTRKRTIEGRILTLSRQAARDRKRYMRELDTDALTRELIAATANKMGI